jgi:predicted dehydrogenase
MESQNPVHAGADPSPRGRREFLRQAATAAAVTPALVATASATAADAQAGLRRLAMVGTGSRGVLTWGAPVLKDYADLVEFVGLCDVNPERAELARELIGTRAPAYTDFDRMLRETRPNTVIVTTVDGVHADYVCRAMEFGCDVICEKPLCTEANQAQAIVDTQKRTGRTLTVTFNARYGSAAMQVKELLQAGTIGDILEVNYDEFLDRRHGADYFRRWHAFKQNSGTLLCHKASHHFDQLNWWIGSDPVEVMAYGRLAVYGHNGPFRHSHCRPCPFKDRCQFHWDVTKDEEAMRMYVACEDQDGYLRDGCVFRPGIDVPDTATAQIRYAAGPLVCYSLNAAVPYEGQFIVFNGTKGRIELRDFHRQPWEVSASAEIRVTTADGATRLIPVQAKGPGHGGSDKRLRDAIFRPAAADPLGQRAGMREGLMSSLVGIAGYTSIAERRPVRIADLVRWA